MIVNRLAKMIAPSLVYMGLVRALCGLSRSVRYVAGTGRPRVLEVEIHGFGVVKHARSYLLCGGFAQGVGDNSQGEAQRRSRAIAGDKGVEGYDGSVAPYAFAGQFLSAGVACAFAAVDDAERPEHHGGSGADGCYFPVVGVVVFKESAERGVGGKVGSAGKPAGYYEPFDIVEVGMGEQQVGFDRDAVGTGDHRVGEYRHRLDVHAGSAHHVDYSEGLYLFKARSKE